MGSIPGWGTKIQHAAEYGQILKNKNKETEKDTLTQDTAFSCQEKCNSRHPPQRLMSAGVAFGRRPPPQWPVAVLRDGCQGWATSIPHPRQVHSPHPGQVHGPLLRLNYVSPADSGEYSCQVSSSSGTLEASVLVNIEASSPSPIPGERQEPRVVLGHRLGAPSWPCSSCFSPWIQKGPQPLGTKVSRGTPAPKAPRLLLSQWPSAMPAALKQVHLQGAPAGAHCPLPSASACTPRASAFSPTAHCVHSPRTRPAHPH